MGKLQEDLSNESCLCPRNRQAVTLRNGKVISEAVIYKKPQTNVPILNIIEEEEEEKKVEPIKKTSKKEEFPLRGRQPKPTKSRSKSTFQKHSR